MTPADASPKIPPSPLRILFAGTPEIALVALDAIIAAGGVRTANAAASDTGAPCELVGVLTNPDRPAGRSRQPIPSPVAARARELALPCLQFERLDGAARAAVAALIPDLLVVVAYGRIFGPRFLALFPRGGINLHPSLLPRHRGPSPLQAAILAGDDVTGVTIQALAAEMDAGEIILQQSTPLGRDETVGELHDRLAAMGAEMLVEAIGAIAEGSDRRTPQDHSAATWCQLIDKRDGELSFDRDAVALARAVRAYTPWPGARCRWGERVLTITAADVVEAPEDGAEAGDSATAAPVTAPKPGGSPTSAQAGTVVGVDSARRILVQTADGMLAVRRLKLQSRSEVDARAFLNGNPSIVGSRLTGLQ